MNAQDALKKLKDGNDRYKQDKQEGAGRDSARRAELTKSQSPFAIILSCADSRVAPELIFDSGIGELFVIRVAGNISNTDAIASIEYAVENCGSKLVVVLGHQSCGAVDAAMKAGDLGYNLNHLLAQLKPAVCASGSDAEIETVVRKNASLQAEGMVSRSEILTKALDSKGVEIVSAYYSLETGAVDFS